MDTNERIEEILKDMVKFEFNEFSIKILELQLENLVTQAQLELLQRQI